MNFIQVAPEPEIGIVEASSAKVSPPVIATKPVTNQTQSANPIYKRLYNFL
jgi:hypothetical protein